MIEKLLPPNPAKLKGCELVFPDTVFFNLKGNPKMIVKTDRDFCLIAVRNQSKLQLGLIYNDFSRIIRERKKDQNGIFSLIYHKNFSINIAVKSRGSISPDKSKKLDPNASVGSTSYNRRSNMTS